MCKIYTYSNVADPLTKALPQPKHEAHVRAMGLVQVIDCWEYALEVIIEMIVLPCIHDIL
jgi:hypothetical protein